MNSKLGWHFQQIENADLVNSEFVKVIDPSRDNPFPGRKIIGRTFMEDADSNTLIWTGGTGAVLWMDRWRGVYQDRPWVHAWEGPNEEHPLADPAFRLQASRFTERLSILMAQEGLKLVGHNWSVGWSDKGHAPEFEASIRSLYTHGHYLGLHEYSAPAMWDTDNGYLTLRYRRTFKELRDAGIPIPKVIIGECGIDGGVYTVGRPKTGWKTYTNPADYMAQLAWYDNEICQDEEIAAAFVFTSGPYPDWWDFDVNREMSELLNQHIATFKPGPITPHIPDSSPQLEKPVQDVTPPALSTFTPPIVNMIGKMPTYAKVSPDKKLRPFRHREVGDIKRVVIHHSGGMQRPPGDIKRWIRRVARWQIRKYGWEGFAYNAVADADGVLYLTNDVKTVTHHSGNWWMNDEGLGLLLPGDFSHGEDVPTDAQLATAVWYVQKQGKRVLPHKRVPHPKPTPTRKWVQTACCGDLRARWWKALKEASK